MSKLTNDHLEKAKAKHGDVFVIEVEAGTGLNLSEDESVPLKELKKETTDFKPEEGKFYAILQKPDKKVIGYAMTQKNPVAMGEFMLKNCIVEIDKEMYCDPEIFDQEDITIAAALQVTEFIEIGQAKIKKY